MHNHPIFLGIMVFALLCVGAYVFVTPSLRNGLPLFAQQQHAPSYAGEYETGLPAGDSVGRKIYLVVGADNKVIMKIDYLDNKPVITETGDATMESQGILVITLTKKDGEDLKTAEHLYFTLQDKTLTLQDPVDAGYGTNGLKLKKN